VNLPPPSTTTVTLPLDPHVYAFRRLTWEDEVTFSDSHVLASRVEYVAGAMVSVDGKGVSFEQALAILKAFPLPMRERIVVFYYGSLPDRRVWEVDNLYMAPEASIYTARLDDETEAIEAEGDTALERAFGKDDVEESMELGRKMLEGTKRAGVTPAYQPPDPEPAVPTPHRTALQEHDVPGVW
jgi:hypothetical protein